MQQKKNKTKIYQRNKRQLKKVLKAMDKQIPFVCVVGGVDVAIDFVGVLLVTIRWNILW
jgi:hypothetical protein